jgi:amino-acid N-acetyltransferase
MVIEAAETSDLPAVRRLLGTHHLPLDGVDEHVATMVVARDGGEVVGAAAVELYADGALLRSVVVDASARGRGLGHRLTESALDVARRHGAATAFLLTTTAEAFFRRLGFERVSREDVPASVRMSVEFRSACPASAIVMRKPLTVEPTRGVVTAAEGAAP